MVVSSSMNRIPGWGSNGALFQLRRWCRVLEKHPCVILVPLVPSSEVARLDRGKLKAKVLIMPWNSRDQVLGEADDYLCVHIACAAFGQVK